MTPMKFYLPCLLASLSISLRAYEVHVSPAGPIASLEAARDAVRAWRAGDGKGKPESVRVNIAPGTYAIKQPVVFAPQDGGTEQAPISYEAEGKVVLRAYPVNSWSY